MAIDDSLAALTELSDQGIPTPGVSAPAPPAALAAPAGPAPMPSPSVALPPHPHPGLDWKSILQVIAPMIGEMASPNSHGRFLNAFMEGQQAAQDHARQQQADLEHKNAAKSDYLMRATEHAQGLDDPADFANFVHLAQMGGEKAGYLQPNELTSQLTFSPTKANKAKLKEIDDQLSAYERAGYDLDQLSQSGASIELKDHTSIPIKAAIDLTRREPMSASGQPIAKPKAIDVTQKTEEERFIEKWARDNGQKPSELSADDELAARKAFREAGRQEPTGPKSDAGQQFEDLVALWKESNPGKDPPPAVRVKLREQAARGMAEARQKPTDPSTALTDDGVDFAATQYRVTGVMPPMGMGSAGARSAIINRAAKQAHDLGQSPASAIQKQSAYKADAASLTQMRKASSAAESFETKALAQADIISELSAKVPRTSYPIINSALQSGRTAITGDESATKLANAIQTFSAEYAKIIEGSTGSAAGSSDSARRASERLINAAMSKGTMAGVIDLMKREMALTVSGYGATIDHIQNRMGGSPPSATPDASGATVWVFKNGKLVKQ